MNTHGHLFGVYLSNTLPIYSYGSSISPILKTPILGGENFGFFAEPLTLKLGLANWDVEGS